MRIDEYDKGTIMAELSVLLIGGSGFIGSHVAARLAEKGVSIAVPTRHEAHAMHLMPLGVRELHAPPHIGGAANDLPVDEIADAAHAEQEGARDDDVIREDTHRQSRHAREHPDCGRCTD